MILWKAFVLKGKIYSLEHLHPFALEVIQEAISDKPERKYPFSVSFSLHCFSKKINPSDNKNLYYKDSREERTFCFNRYELSKKLPEIIKEIGKKKCNHTEHGNFFIVEILKDDGNTINYEIYFKVTKGKGGNLNLYIESAYPRDDEHPRKKKKKPIGFYVIAYNKLHNKPIKAPK